MHAFWSGALLIATLGLTVLGGGLIVLACVRGDPPTDFERRQAAQRGETIREFRRRSRPY